MHFLIVCPVFAHLRKRMLHIVEANLRNSKPRQMEHEIRSILASEVDLFKYIMQSRDREIIYEG